ncbi:hypothetical protein ACIRPU_42045 [Streptomyces sp. NPDC102259]|uniref:hypothetical protein n=1 Tax=Streptomyces sp. NPDC102259 TaxID=3366148 RepID=UPI00380F9825
MELPQRWLSERGPSPAHDREDLASELLMLICGVAVRPALPWMLTRTHRQLATVMAQVRDPDGFARLHQLAAAGPASSRKDAQIAATRIATLLAPATVAAAAVCLFPCFLCGFSRSATEGRCAAGSM